MCVYLRTKFHVSSIIRGGGGGGGGGGVSNFNPHLPQNEPLKNTP